MCDRAALQIADSSNWSAPATVVALPLAGIALGVTAFEMRGFA